MVKKKNAQSRGGAASEWGATPSRRREKPVPMELLDTLTKDVQRRSGKYNRWALTWKSLFRSLIIVATVSSAGAAVVPKLDLMIESQKANQLAEVWEEEMRKEFPDLTSVQFKQLTQKREFLQANFRGDIAALLAIAATVLTGIIGLLEIETNWHANRQARHRLDALAIYLKHLRRDATEGEYNSYVEEFRNILLERADRISPAGFTVAQREKVPGGVPATEDGGGV